MKNDKTMLMVIIGIIAVLIGISIVMMANKPIPTRDRNIPESTGAVLESTESENKNESNTSPTIETNSESQKFIDNGSGNESLAENKTEANQETTNIGIIPEESSQEEEILKGGDEYNFPDTLTVGENRVVEGKLVPNGSGDTSNNEGSNTSNSRFAIGNYQAKDVKVDLVGGQKYVRVYLNNDQSLYGSEADTKLIEYNNSHKAKYTVECDPGWENILVRIGIEYSETVDDPNKKIEPVIRINGTNSYSGINWQGHHYNIPVSILYDSKEVDGRTGYIVLKVPTSLKKFYVVFGNEIVTDENSDEQSENWEYEFIRE